MYSHSRRTRESRRLCAIVRGANASRLRFVRPFDFFIGRESPSILARNASSRDAKTLRNSQPSVTRQAKSPFPTRVPFRVGVGVSRSEGRRGGKSQIGSLPFESGGVEESLEGAQHPEIEPSPIGCGCRKVLEPNCPSNFITAGFKTTEDLSRDLRERERERRGLLIKNDAGVYTVFVRRERA